VEAEDIVTKVDLVGIQDVTKEAEDALVKSLSSRFPEYTEEELAGAAARAPEHIIKLGDQASKLWRELTAIKESVLTKQDRSTSEEPARAIGTVGFRDFGLREDVRKLADINPDKIVEDAIKGDETAMKAVRAIGTVGFRDFGLREDVRSEEEETSTEPARAIGTVGFRDFGLREDVRSEDNTEMMLFLERLRETNPEYFVDTPPDVMDGDTASQVVAQARTGADRRPNNVGLMSPRPEEPDTEQPPAMEESVESLVDNGVRVHGESSSTTRLIKKVRDQLTRGTKVKTSDITKIIRDTSKLPKTETRDSLLMQLYELRDTLKNS
jgi:hypothetical protein